MKVINSVRLLFDIETNGFLDELTVVHSLVIKDLDKEKLYSFYGDSIAAGLQVLEEADVLIGHNIQSFDIPALQKVYPEFKPKALVRDTYLISRLIWPDIEKNDLARADKGANFPRARIGEHSIESWGYRLGVLKHVYNGDWLNWSPELQLHCEQDVAVNEVLWRLMESLHYSERAIQLEHDFAAVMFLQEQRGFDFDKEKADKLVAHLLARRAELMPKLQEAFPPVVEEMKKPAYYEYDWHGVLIDGTRQFSLKREAELSARRDKNEHGLTVSPIRPGRPKQKVIPFNPDSGDQITVVLKARGWQPTSFTKTGKPSTNYAALEDAFAVLNDPVIQVLKDYLVVQKRLEQIAEGPQAWMNLVKPDGRIHGGVIGNGTVTGRCAHVNPNMGQVPAKKDRRGRVQPYGAECRELFYAPAPFVLLGLDVSGLEARGLAHFLAKYDGGAYIKVVTEGDIHTTNKIAAGLNDRNKAKTFFYAYLYGASDWKLGFTAELAEGDIEAFKERKLMWKASLKKLQWQKKSTDDANVAMGVKGALLRAKFETGIPGLIQLRKAVEDRVTEMTARGYRRLKHNATIHGLDGRLVPIRSKHSALNTLIQGAGALIVKLATVILFRMCLERGWKFGIHFANVAHVHDEMQILVLPELADELGKMGIAAIQEAGASFGIRCPLTGEYKIGKTWNDTH